LLARLQKGDALIVAKLDRAFRNAADALATAEQLKARKVDLIVADMGSEPVTQNGVSRMFFGMLALVAEFERERTRERLADGRGAKRAAGGHIGGSAPFGYHKVGAGRSARLEPIPEQQDAILTMHRLAAREPACASSPRRSGSSTALSSRTSRCGPPCAGPRRGSSFCHSRRSPRDSLAG
jgi:DNA invertase Pin-like site-specific DNA recombinase